MKVQMSLQQTQMDRFYLLISLLWMRSSIRNLARFVEIPYLVSVEDVFQLVGVSMVKYAMVAYNTSMVAYAQVYWFLLIIIYMSCDLGSVLSGGGSTPSKHATPKTWVNMVNDFQNGALSTRLGIPILMGLMLFMDIVLPMEDPLLIKKIGAATALEVRATGIQYTFAPCIAVCRDPGWGPCYESYNKDPEIVRLLTKIISGLQGEITDDSEKGAPFVNGQQKIVACAKHYVGDGETHLGENTGNMMISSKKMFDIHMPAYNDSVIKGVATIMTSYSSWNGVKMHSNRKLVTGYLKNKLKFKVHVLLFSLISDITSIEGKKTEQFR
ncbi:putative glucan 1,3-beta-glucosidase [Helianthus debilis subsp. tardiflorus]